MRFSRFSSVEFLPARYGRGSCFGERSRVFSARAVSTENYVKRARKGAASVNKWLAENLWEGSYVKSYGDEDGRFVEGYEDCFMDDYYPFCHDKYPNDPEGSGKAWALYVSKDKNFFADFYWEAVDIIEAKHPETVDFLDWYNNSGKSRRKRGDSDIGWYNFKDYLQKGMSPKEYALELYEDIECERYWEAYKTCVPFFRNRSPAVPYKRKKGEPHVSVKWKNRALKALAAMLGGAKEDAEAMYSWQSPSIIYEVSDECPSPMSYPISPETLGKILYVVGWGRTPSYPFDLSYLVGKF